MESLEALWKLYNDNENCIPNLKFLRIESSTYGYLLIPLVFYYIYINDLHDMQIITDKNNYQIP